MNRWAIARVTVEALALLGVLRAARADEPETRLDLRWTAPAECPSRADELADISRILGASNGARRDVAAIAIIVRDGPRWHARLSTRTAQGAGDRAFEAVSCDAIAHAVALIVALAVDEQAGAPSMATEAPSSPPATSSAPEAPSAMVAPSVTPQPEAEESRRRPPDAPSRPGDYLRPAASHSKPMVLVPRLAVSWSVGGDSSALPSPAPGAELSAGLALARSMWRARSEGYVSYFPPRTATVSSNPHEGGRFSLVATGVRIWAGASVGRWVMGPCAAGELDFMSATAFGEPGASTPGGHAAWGALAGGGLVSFVLDRLLSLRFRAEAVLPLVRPRFVVEEPDSAPATLVHRAGSVSGRAFVGAELDFF